MLFFGICFFLLPAVCADPHAVAGVHPVVWVQGGDMYATLAEDDGSNIVQQATYAEADTNTNTNTVQQVRAVPGCAGVLTCARRTAAVSFLPRPSICVHVRLT